MSEPIEFHDIADGLDSWYQIVQQARRRGLLDADIPAGITRVIREEQVARLQSNLQLLKAKQDEFNRRIGAYTQQIEALLTTLAREETDAPHPSPQSPVLHVRCVGCGRERNFDGYTVVKAFEPAQNLDGPTELWVHTPEGLRRGMFRCPECGAASLTTHPAGSA